MMGFVIGVDIGGTFTDGVAVDLTNGALATAKSPTTYPDPFAGVVSVIDELAGSHELERSQLLSGAEKFVHATTLTSNVVLERRGAKVGLVATQGFGDAILMMSGKGRVAGLSLMERRHFRATDKPEPIVPRRRVVEVPERVDVDGDVVVELSDEVIDHAVREVEALGVDACAVALLWSFRNPEHESRLADALEERVPGLYVSRSHKLAPLLGEYERTATAVINSYVGPAVSDYLDNVEHALGREGLAAPLLVVQSSGGVAVASEVQPVSTIESGPAAGVRGSTSLLEQLGLDHAIVTDVGGTTFKVTIVRDREPELTTETVLGQYSLLVPMIDVVSIGAGGGSIAWVDGQRLRVGPASAGSDPGPACYGWGGTEPTVTDADLVLGYLNPDFFLGGRMKLDVEAAWTAIEERIATPLFGGDTVKAAAGIREVINTQMADLIRKASLERGHDPRDFVVLAYGGAGPVHCSTFAAELGAPKIVVPPNATVYSAYGAALSDVLHNFSLSRQLPAPGDPQQIAADLAELERQAREVLARQGIPESDLRLSAWADLRYRRQFFDLRVPLPEAGAVDDDALREAVRRFERQYVLRYGEGARHGEERVEYVRFGLDARGVMRQPVTLGAPRADASAEEAIKAQREVHWRDAGRVLSTPIYDGALMRPGHELVGPAIIEHVGTSIVVHAGQTARIDANLNTIIDLEEGLNDGRRPSHL